MIKRPHFIQILRAAKSWASLFASPSFFFIRSYLIVMFLFSSLALYSQDGIKNNHHRSTIAVIEPSRSQDFKQSVATSDENLVNSRVNSRAIAKKPSFRISTLPSLNDRFTLVGLIAGGYASQNGSKHGVIILQDSRQKDKRYFVGIGAPLPGLPGSKILAVERNRVIVASGGQDMQISHKGFDDLRGGGAESYASSRSIGTPFDNSGSRFGASESEDNSDSIVIQADPAIEYNSYQGNHYVPPPASEVNQPVYANPLGGGPAPGSNFDDVRTALPFGPGRNFHPSSSPTTSGNEVDYSLLQRNIQKAKNLDIQKDHSNYVPAPSSRSTSKG